jgi:hypothetical protein
MLLADFSHGKRQILVEEIGVLNQQQNGKNFNLAKNKK